MGETKIHSGLVKLPLAPQYRTGQVDPILEFYRPCLLNAIAYDRAVGFFRSSVYLIVGQATVEFARRGGEIRLICSPALDAQDAKNIEASYSEREDEALSQLDEQIGQLIASEELAYRTRILATLIKSGSMDIRLAIRPAAFGLYHEKIGIFRDTIGQQVSFIGSANETWNGWHSRGNFESIEVFCSWKGALEAERVERHSDYFEQLWGNQVSDIDIIPFPDAAKQKLIQHAFPGGLNEVDLKLLDFQDVVETSAKSENRNPLPHQSIAIENWKAQGSRGIFEHATGSGKTFTALLAVNEHTSKGLPALILVPSHLLLEQWATEIKSEISNVVMLLAGAGNDRWKTGSRLRSLTDSSPELGPRVILATMQTAATDAFIENISQGDHLMIVADEVHQIGSVFNSRSLAIRSGPRLGLSATPRRYSDAEGTARIFDYFGSVVPPPFSLTDAIAAGRLVEYEYFPHPIRLTTMEADEWKSLSKAINREIAKQKNNDSGTKPLNDKARMLLIRRARIAKKAAGKARLAAEILGANYHKGERWLIYCEDNDQLKHVKNAIEAMGLSASEYHSAMSGDKAGTLEWFREFGGILVSIRCLDEGVDIPAISHALILASSQNPRQFIQRRGRVLRKSPDKQLAIIHDAIVVPVSLVDEPEQLSLLKAEFLRAIEFASSAINRSADAELRSIAADMGFDPEEAYTDAIEEDE